MNWEEEFQPIVIQDTKLPNANEVRDRQIIEVKKKLYIMIDGEWYLINTLTKVTWDRDWETIG